MSATNVVSVLLLCLCSTHAHTWEAVLIDGLNGTQLFSPNGDQSTVTNEHYNLPHKFRSVGVFYNGEAYFIGGRNQSGESDDGYSAEVKLFNPHTSTVAAGVSLTYERSNHAATVLNNSIITCGGRSANDTLTSCEQFSYLSDKWEMFTDLPKANFDFSMVTLNNLPHAIGGYRAGVQCGASRAVYMFNNGNWTQRASLIYPTRSHASIALDDNTALLCGGQQLKDGYCAKTADCFTFSMSDDGWTTAPPMAKARQSHAMVVLEGVIYIMGGEEIDGGTTIEVYDPKTGGRLLNAKMTRDVAMAAVAMTNDTIIATTSTTTTSTAAPTTTTTTSTAAPTTTTTSSTAAPTTTTAPPAAKAGNMVMSINMFAVLLLSLLCMS